MDLVDDLNDFYASDISSPPADEMQGIKNEVPENESSLESIDILITEVESINESSEISLVNEIYAKVQEKIEFVVKLLQRNYAFIPELPSLIPDPKLLSSTITTIQNDLSNIPKLKAILPPSLFMIINVTISTSNSLCSDISENDKHCLLMAAKLDSLLSFKQNLLSVIQARIIRIAPNLHNIIGATTAAYIIGAAGGLTELSKIPACNLQVLGKNSNKNDFNTGLFIKGQEKHAGYLYFSDLVSGVKKEFKNKAVRMLSAKCCLAARIDRAGEFPDGSLGLQYKQEILSKLEKAMEPPPSKNVKSLPLPDNYVKKRRGGKRQRRLKEKLSMTEEWKAQNRMKFGEAEEEVLVGDTVKGLGLLGGSTGKVRMGPPAPVKKLGLAKKHREFNTSGVASSLSFTPVQGLELENPDAVAQRKANLEAASNKYFSGFKK